MGIIDFLDAHFIGLSVVFLTAWTITWVARTVVASTTTTTISRVISTN